MADITVSKYWAENLVKLQEMLSDGVVYVDFVMRDKAHRYDITMSDMPFTNDSAEAYKGWRENAICAFRVNFEDQKRADIWTMWEAHTIASILTISGYEVMMGNKLRRPGAGAVRFAVRAGTSNMLSNSIKSFKEESTKAPPEEPDYTPYSEALFRKAASFNAFGELPQTSETVNTFGDIPAERFVRDTSNAALMEEGM